MTHPRSVCSTGDDSMIAPPRNAGLAADGHVQAPGNDPVAAVATVGLASSANSIEGPPVNGTMRNWRVSPKKSARLALGWRLLWVERRASFGRRAGTSSASASLKNSSPLCC